MIEHKLFITILLVEQNHMFKLEIQILTNFLLREFLVDEMKLSKK